MHILVPNKETTFCTVEVNQGTILMTYTRKISGGKVVLELSSVHMYNCL